MDVPGETVEELVHHWGLQEPDTEAFVSLHPDTHERRSVTRHDVNLLARKFAARLRQEGVGRGEVVCVALPNCLERVVVDLGVICSGAVALNGQVFRADGEDFLQALVDSKATAVVLDPEPPGGGVGAWSILQQHVKDLHGDVRCPRLPDLRRVITCHRYHDDPDRDFLSSLRRFHKSLQRAHALPSEVAVIWTTSGSTGYSKLVPQTHANLVHIARQVLRIARLDAGDAFLNCAPLGWAGGFPLWFLASGAKRVFLDVTDGPPRDMAAALWGCVRRERCVYVFASPMYVAAVLDRPELWQQAGEGRTDGGDRGTAVTGGQDSDPGWRPTAICLAGQPMKNTLVSRALSAGLCRHVDINYGTTECGVVATGRYSRPQDHEDGLTGAVAWGTELRLVDGDLRDVPQGHTGQVLARNPALHGRYLGPASQEAAAHAFTADGWFRTDDVGYLRPDGQLVHLGRRQDAITRGAYLCYPAWLEGLLRGSPDVSDVCVVPVPDPVLHHEICACVVPSAPGPAPQLESRLRTFADSLLATQPGDAQHLAPRYYVALPALPLTTTGKLSRKEAAALARKHLGMGSG